MSAPSEGSRRYPKRKRAAISYAENNETSENSEQDEEEDGREDTNAMDQRDDADESEDDMDWRANKAKRQKLKTKTKRKPKVPKPQVFRLMDLPAELRDMIYKRVVTHQGGPVYMESPPLVATRIRRRLAERVGEEDWTLFKERRRFRNLRLLRVSKQVYQEASYFFYKQTFAFHRVSALQTFLLLQRPDTMTRLQHIEARVGDAEWGLMPGVAEQIAQLSNLESLKLVGLNYRTSGRDLYRYLDQTKRPMQEWAVNLESMDKMKGIKLARDTYPFLFPLYKAVVQDRGVEMLAELVHCEEARRHGIRRWTPTWSNWYDIAGRRCPKFDKLMGQFHVEPTKERKAITKGAMAEEVARLLDEDTY